MKAYLICGLALFVGGCVLAPKEAKQTKDDLARDGATYAAERAVRTVPDLPDEPAWQDVLRRAFLANGDLEAAYFEWAMAVSKIDQAGSYPSQPIEIGFEYMFGGPKMKSWDRTTLSAGLMDATAWPNKTYQNARIAWRDAEATGEQFRSAKFKLQREVLTAWYDFALQSERVRIQEENVDLLKLVYDTASGRVRAGAPQQDLLRSDVQQQLAQNELAKMRSQLDQQRARLNALLVRDPHATLNAPTLTPRSLAISDDQLLAFGVEANPELKSLAALTDGRHDAIERAKMEYLPDFNLMGGFTGSMTQFIGASLVLPTEFPKIRAMIEESKADLRRVIATRDQARATTAGNYVAAIVALRDAERQISLFEQSILPLAQQTIDLSRQSYAAGSSGYLDLIDAQRTLLEVRLALVEAKAEREKTLAEIEMLAGADLETLNASSTAQPTIQEQP